MNSGSILPSLNLHVITGLVPRDVEEHAKALLAELQIDGLVHGNVTKDVRRSVVILGASSTNRADLPDCAHRLLSP